MTLSILARYLIGRRDAILALAQDHWAIPIGVLLVFSVALARKYDGHDLLHEPWVLLGGFVAAMINSFILYVLFWLAACRRGAVRPGFLEGYKSFLGLFLLTAPMAWLYGIPFERFMEPDNAVAANLWILAAVSLWRVVLMTRVFAVLYQIAAWRSFFIVMLFADVVAIAALGLMPKPIIAAMGGIEYAPGEQVLAEAAFITMVLAMLTLPVWIIGALGVLWGYQPRWALTERPPQAASGPYVSSDSDHDHCDRELDHGGDHRTTGAKAANKG